MKTAIKSLWRLLSALCVLAVLAAAAAAVKWRADGTLSEKKLATIRDVIKDKPIYTEMPTEGAVGEALTELESKQSRYDEQTQSREEALNELAISLKRDQEALRQAEDNLRKDREAFTKERDAWTALRAPREADEQEARRREVYRQMRDMAPKEIVDILVTYDHADLKQMLKLFKDAAADLIPVLRKHPKMEERVGDSKTTQFDLFWQEYNKPEPIPTPE